MCGMTLGALSGLKALTLVNYDEAREKNGASFFFHAVSGDSSVCSIGTRPILLYIFSCMCWSAVMGGNLIPSAVSF